MEEFPRQTSFAEVAFAEAAARRVRVNCIIKPVHEDDPRQLASRFLAQPTPERLILAAATKPNGQKVFLPTGWKLGLGFAVGNLFMQAQATVLGQILFSARPGRRIDAIEIGKPDKVVSITRRREIRYEVEDPHLTCATVWCEAALFETGPGVGRQGRVVNWSDTGLGICVPAEIPFPADTPVILRVQNLREKTCRYFRAHFRHCTHDYHQGWLAGFADVAEIAPGECFPLIERLADGTG
jgi:hypothetical protein